MKVWITRAFHTDCFYAEETDEGTDRFRFFPHDHCAVTGEQAIWDYRYDPHNLPVVTELEDGPDIETVGETETRAVLTSLEHLHEKFAKIEGHDPNAQEA